MRYLTILFAAILVSASFSSKAEARVALTHYNVIKHADGTVTGILRLRWEEKPWNGKKWVLLNYDQEYKYKGSKVIFNEKKVLGQQKILGIGITVAVWGKVRLFDRNGQSCVQGTLKIGGDSINKRYKLRANCRSY